MILAGLFVAWVVALSAQAPTRPSTWQIAADPASAGFDARRLAVLREWLKTQHTTGLVVGSGGKVAFQYGEVARISKVASVRKSILAMLEKRTGKDLYDALETDLARPIGMEDFDRRRQRKIDVRPASVHPEYAMYLSARDMARIGVLMARQGKWNGREVVPEDWIRTITTLVTPQQDIHPEPLGASSWAHRWGYGMLWWVWDSPNIPGTVTGPYQRAFTAMGAYGQYITVLPVLDLVVAHQVGFDEEDERQGRAIAKVAPDEYDAILQMIIAARR